mmetsp:Transcript_25201/g.72911  ORF Transcript_25201/g.72911 Transcript_25201/m.72911 type:complete len:354 (-) Transcript_25201:365-1426(-)
MLPRQIVLGTLLDLADARSMELVGGCLELGHFVGQLDGAGTELGGGGIVVVVVTALHAASKGGCSGCHHGQWRFDLLLGRFDLVGLLLLRRCLGCSRLLAGTAGGVGIVRPLLTFLLLFLGRLGRSILLPLVLATPLLGLLGGIGSGSGSVRLLLPLPTLLLGFALGLSRFLGNRIPINGLVEIVLILPLGQLDVADVDEEGIVVEFLPTASNITVIITSTTTIPVVYLLSTTSAPPFSPRLLLDLGPPPVLAGGHDLLHHLVAEHGIVEEAIVGALVAVHRPLAGVVGCLGGVLGTGGLGLGLALAVTGVGGGVVVFVQDFQPTDMDAPHVLGLEVVQDRPVVLPTHTAASR